jgi:apolipoprotein N-acyltransferase
VAENREEKPKETSKSRLPGLQVIGWAFVLLVLAGYFLWMTVEMGRAAVSGAAPMIAFLVAAFIGIAAAGAAMALGRRGR